MMRTNDQQQRIDERNVLICERLDALWEELAADGYVVQAYDALDIMHVMLESLHGDLLLRGMGEPAPFRTHAPIGRNGQYYISRLHRKEFADRLRELGMGVDTALDSGYSAG